MKNNIIKKSFKEHLRVTHLSLKLLKKKIFMASEAISETLINNGKLIFCGNGGSASDSLHLSSEFVGKFQNKRKPLSSISLSSDISNITCIANDFGYKKIFSRQLEAIGKKNDLLICLTTSGNSENIIECLKYAKNNLIKSILLSGISGGEAKKYSNINLLVPSKNTARIQEMHLLIGQTLCELVEKKMKFK